VLWQWLRGKSSASPKERAFQLDSVALDKCSPRNRRANKRSQFYPFWFTTSSVCLRRHPRPNYVGGQRLGDRPRAGCTPLPDAGPPCAAESAPTISACGYGQDAELPRLQVVSLLVESLVLLLLDVEAEPAALDLLRAIYDLTDGVPQHWCMLEELRGATNSAAIYALTRGWIVIEAGHSICLTDPGRRLVEAR
jgi:hypothetical protein